jgi:zinc finger protein
MGYSYHNEKEENKTSKIFQEKLPFEVYKSNSHISAHLMDMTKSIENEEGSDAIIIPEVCLVCKKMGENRVCVITIPFFKELIITCFSCNECNFKSCEVKGGGGISDKGQKITLSLKEPNDLNRDMFKSETSQVIIPELNFETSAGSLGSMFTTVEGLLQKIISNIKDTAFTQGDSGDSEEKSKFEDFIKRIENIKDNFEPFTLIIDDPSANSFIFSINHENPENDKNLKIEDYERSWEQNEDLGLNNMIVENYEESFAKEKKIQDSKKITVIKEEDIEEYDKTD